MNFSLSISSILWTVKMTKISWFVHNDLSFLNDLIELIVLIMSLSTACDHSILQFELLKFVWTFSHDMFWACLLFYKTWIHIMFVVVCYSMLTLYRESKQVSNKNSSIVFSIIFNLSEFFDFSNRFFKFDQNVWAFSSNRMSSQKNEKIFECSKVEWRFK